MPCNPSSLPPPCFVCFSPLPHPHAGFFSGFLSPSLSLSLSVLISRFSSLRSHFCTTELIISFIFGSVLFCISCPFTLLPVKLRFLNFISSSHARSYFFIWVFLVAALHSYSGMFWHSAIVFICDFGRFLLLRSVWFSWPVLYLMEKGESFWTMGVGLSLFFKETTEYLILIIIIIH